MVEGSNGRDNTIDERRTRSSLEDGYWGRTYDRVVVEGEEVDVRVVVEAKEVNAKVVVGGWCMEG